MKLPELKQVITDKTIETLEYEQRVVDRIVSKAEQTLVQVTQNDGCVPLRFTVGILEVIHYWDSSHRRAITRDRNIITRAARQYEAKLKASGWLDACVTPTFWWWPLIPNLKVKLGLWVEV